VRALLVEDEALVALIAEEALAGLGFQVHAAATASEALEAFEQGRPDLAVIDIGLPDMRGDDLARQIRAKAPDLAIIMASGYDAADVAARFAGDQNLSVVSKPYTEGDLANAIGGLGLRPSTTG
jgi:CheY-like chemotaxis protein